MPVAPEAAPSAVESVTVTDATTTTTEKPVDAKGLAAAVNASAPKPSAETAALAQIDKMAAYAVTFIDLALDEVSVGRLLEKLAAATLTIAAARDKRFPAKAAATSADLNALKGAVEQHVAA
jgi:hypothetical protein